MTRREFLSVAAVGIVPAISQAPLVVPVHFVLDDRAKLNPALIRRFWSRIWPEAVRDLGRCGVRLESSFSVGDVWRPPHREPVITGLDRGVINFVITDRIPIQWDKGRAWSGVTTRYRGHHLCMVALSRAHGHQIPFLSVNTCVHELLHVLLHDIFEDRPKGLLGQAREVRIDLYATRLWLLHEGGSIRESAEAYVERLRSDFMARAG